MYVFSSILITIPFISKIFFNIFKPLKLFENQKALSLFTISFLTGNPTSTILVKKAYLNNEISLIQANNIIDSSSHISFLLSTSNGCIKYASSKIEPLISIPVL